MEVTDTACSGAHPAHFGNQKQLKRIRRNRHGK